VRARPDQESDTKVLNRLRGRAKNSIW